MISVEALYLSFDNKEVLKNISLYVQKSGITVVLGKNGSGKSVLLKCVAGLLGYDSGSVTIGDELVTPEIYEKEREGGVVAGYVFQKGGLFDSMSVFDNIAFGMRRKKIDEETIGERVLQALDEVGLAGAEDKFPSELSGGMQKRVGLARSLCMDSKVILYDDPTAGLDPILTDSIADLILEIRDKEQVTSIIVTHDLTFARKVADNIVLLYRGECVYSGSNEGFFSHENAFAHQFIEGETEGPIEI